MKPQILIFLCIFFLLNAGFQSLAQNDKSFEIRYQSYVKGKMSVIGNNIINTSSAHNSDDPYDKVDRSAKLNDQMDMKYITIVQSDEIFSASAADLIVTNQENANIVYAGLYWSATYPYESGEQKPNGKFYATNKKREAVDQVMLLLPNQEKFVKIAGEILFDGIDTKGFEDNAPYVAYADVTAEIQKLDKPFGSYIVANVRATQGKISGGSAGGWMMIFVIEDPSEKGRHFTSYDGFRNVNNQVIDVDFTGFKTPEKGHFQARIAGAALEGDLNLKGDQLLFKAENTNGFTFLNSTSRAFNNFFNSSITIDNEYFSDRIPNSKNTLGFDVFLMTISNLDNTIVPNNSTHATLRLKSTTDRYFMFFTALEIESTIEVLSAENSNVSSIGSLNEEKIINSEINLNKVKIRGIKKGYYLVANVFSNLNYANAFSEKLNKENYSTKTFDNAENGYRYVYIGFHDHYEEALKQYLIEKEKKQLEAFWIAAVNID